MTRDLNQSSAGWGSECSNTKRQNPGGRRGEGPYRSRQRAAYREPGMSSSGLAQALYKNIMHPQTKGMRRGRREPV